MCERCLNCEKEINVENGYRVYKPQRWYNESPTPVGWICEDCLGDGYEICEVTGLCFADDDLEWIQDKDYYVNTWETTHGDYYCCDECGKFFSDEHMHIDDYDHYVCDDCYDRYGYSTCCECGMILDDNHAYFSNDGDSAYCEGCYESYGDHDDMDGYIHEYGYKPWPIFHCDGTTSFDFDDGRHLMMGVELETDSSSNTSRSEYYDYSAGLHALDENENWFYQKHDCSLDQGVEIVTHPCDLKTYLTSFPWEDIVRVARKYNIVSHDARTCGFHVHVNRKYLGEDSDEKDLTLAKIILLVDRHWDSVYKFSRRTRATIHWGDRPNADILPSDTQVVAIRKAKDRENFRNAVNQMNSNTIEFRVFRGSLNLNTIKATLEFVSNLVNWAKDHTLAEAQNSTFDEIANYVIYPELLQYLAERRLVAETVPAQAA